MAGFLILNGVIDLSDETGEPLFDETGAVLLDESDPGTTAYLLLTDGVSKVFLEEQPDLNVTFPLLTIDAFGFLGPFEGISETFPLLNISVVGAVGPDYFIDETFPLLAIITQGTNPVSVTFPRVFESVFGFTNILAGSGLYQYVEGDTHDTYYDKVTSGATVAIKIPDVAAQTALLHDEEENIIHSAGLRIRVTGEGNLKNQLYTLDSIRVQNLANIALSLLTNREPSVLANFSSNRIMYRMYTEEIDELFEVSRIIVFIKTLYTQRPQ